ncbi:ABC transporter substrate-binding protein [Boudabousia marimammalium]|uniref:ABC transporter substrate-binding protein n=1 Tax=Boudabousia marimammalium TaxID=156892 RepID=A0A1Q5PSC6_9ACTO|nr:ABC transporter substrate-binding protein [Boudabousia marimammalium]OKL50409.1 ABC transporter substrate-binding protein [Boudabousia marimammalium]
MRTSTRRGAKVAAIAAASALILSACSSAGGESKEGTSEGAAPAKDTITAQVAYSTKKFDPSSTSSALALAGNWHVTEGLYDLDMSTFKVYPALAAGEPEMVSPTEYKVTLRDGAKFSNGEAVTPADVVSSFGRTMAEGGLYLSMLDFIDSVTPDGDKAVVIKLKKPFPLAQQRFSLVRIVPEKATAEELTAMPIGSGPWKYTQITDQQVHFEKNDHYNGSKPATTMKMVWNVNTDDTARVTAMQQGDTDVMENVPAKAFETLKSAGAKIETVQGFNQAFIMFNTKQAPFDNVKARQAVLYAIDAQKLIDNQLAGQADPVTSFLPESFANYHKAKNVYTHDVEKAKALLAEAGVSTPLDFTLYTTDHKWVTELAPQIKNNLAEVGINVNIESMKSSALYPNITDVDDATYKMVLAPGDPSVFGNDPDLLMNWWYGDNAWTKKRSFWNGSEGYNKLHEAMDRALAAEGAAQQEAWNECFDILSEEVPLYPLFHRKVSTAIKGDVFSNYEAVGTTGLSFLNAKLK